MVKKKLKCTLCGGEFTPREVLPSELVRSPIIRLIQQQYPQWNNESYICYKDLNVYRGQYITGLINEDRGELTKLEEDVMKAVHDHELVSANIEEKLNLSPSFGDKMADLMCSFGGSWRFIFLFVFVLFVWISLNLYSERVQGKTFDPYPFILLNLILSCLAAIQAPVIMMSQKRQEMKDRLRSEYDYKINLKAEMEIRIINDKIDRLLSHQWQRLLEIQEVQMEIMSEVSRSNSKKRND